MSCVITSVTLQANESYTLPPGATILGASNPSAITSINDCADLTNLETLECYCFQVVCTEEAGGTTPVFKPDNIAITGLYLASNNTSYNFTVANPSTISQINISGAAAIQSTESIGKLISSTCTAYDDGDLDRGQVVTICFKTIPSVGDYLFLNAQTAALLDPDFTAFYKIPAQKYSSTSGTKCACPTT